jgi:sporulation protein YlmC with PRC-barrel domain
MEPPPPAIVPEEHDRRQPGCQGEGGMLHSFDHIRGHAIRASDGEIGSLHDLYFDDQSTAIRYLVVDTGRWLPGRRVLLAPAAIGGLDTTRREIVTGLTRRQVEDSPDVATDRPVSRQQETALYTYYGWDPYWSMPPLAGTLAPYWGAAIPPAPSAAEERVAVEVAARERAEADPHLHSAREVEGYHVAATDGDIGHVEDFLIDDRTWTINLLGIDTRNWLPGRKVVISPGWLRGIDWPNREIDVDLTRDQIKASPEYDPARAVDDAYLERLRAHYGMTLP